MAKILFSDGSYLTVEKAFAPKDESGIVIFTNANNASIGIATTVFAIFGNQRGANKLSLTHIIAFGDNTVEGHSQTEYKQAAVTPRVIEEAKPTVPNADSFDDGLPF